MTDSPCSAIFFRRTWTLERTSVRRSPWYGTAFFLVDSSGGWADTGRSTPWVQDFAVPVISGKEELDRNTLEEIAGPRLAEHEAAMRDAGISRHAAWHQQTPDGTLALVYMEAPDEMAIRKFTASGAPFNAWFRDVMKEVHGVDISQPGPPVTKVLDVQL
jgi:hypothetical protein